MFCLTPYCKQAKLVGEPKVEILRFARAYGKFAHRYQTRRFGFATDGKTQNGHGRPWFHAAAMF
ncbi:hypothetical protein C5O78_11090 [Treponema phagedenis]|nr:hypothetical protein C5O78_11090 [Treponema phagedenis]